MQVLKINSLIENKEKTLRDDRDTIENNLHKQKKTFQENLDKIKVELDRIKDYTQTKSEDEYNKKIAALNQDLVNLTAEMRDIND